ncbi:hypothetical protein MMC06_005937 [Schaereria dolodes]|nr:hypothetical protein [Schaereria dolodes]
MWILKVLSSIAFLTSVILTVPLAFDVGGRACGLAFSLSLASFYFFYSVLKLATPDRSRFRYALIRFIGLTQWIVLPSLLIWSLNRFSVDADNDGGWVERTFSTTRAHDVSVREWIFGPEGLIESITIGSWDKMLRWSTPVFQLCEGFCSLLVIQAAGQITRYLVNRGGRSDSWMIGLLVMSASIISSSVYFLWRITTFPEIGNVDATLIGITITCAVFLCAWGIGSGKGNPVESSLLFAYTVLCIYQIFTDYQPSNPVEPVPPPSQAAADFPPFPPIIMASYTTLLDVLSTMPSTIHFTFNFIVAALSTITPSVIISLAYRLFVLYAATRIIPAVRESGARALSQEASLEDSEATGQLVGLLSYFSPSILIAVFTNLLMQHFASTSGEGGGGEWWTSQGGDPGNNLWRWINLAGTLLLYALELYLGKEDIDGGLTGHWKVD